TIFQLTTLLTLRPSKSDHACDANLSLLAMRPGHTPGPQRRKTNRTKGAGYPFGKMARCRLRRTENLPGDRPGVPCHNAIAFGGGMTSRVYIIDGNNVIGGRVGWHRDKSGSRRLLLGDLARLARAKKLRLNVIFDGAPDPQFPDGSSYRGVRIFYSRPGSDADSRVVEMVEAERNKKSLVVVTSDGKLTSRVRACGARVMR